MKTTLLLALALSFSVVPLRAQEQPQPIPADELAKATQLLMEAASRAGDLPLKLELAPDQAAGLKAGEVGALIIPDNDLSKLPKVAPMIPKITAAISL